MNGFEFNKSKCATDLWHTEYRLHRDPKRVRLIQPDAWRQQNNIKAPADGWVLPRRSFWPIVGPHNLRQPWSQPDIRLDGWPSGVSVMEWGASVTRLFFSLSLSFCLIIGFQSDWIIEGAAGPAEGHDRHDAVSSRRLTFWLLTGTQAAFLFARIF